MAVPKYFAAIDFDKDGDFTGCNEEITSDVRVTSVFSYKVHRGVNLRKHRVESANLELFLNNEDHTYSPFNPGSPLNDPCTNTSVFPAPDLWFMAGYPVDDFNRADCTNLTSQSPSHDSNFTWEGDTCCFVTCGCKLKASSAANLTAVLDYGESCGYVGTRFTRGNCSACNCAKSGLVFRWTDACNYWVVFPSGNTAVVLAKVACGVLSSVGTGTPGVWAQGDTHWLFAQLHGDRILVSRDNDLIIDTAATCACDCFNNTATKHGIGGRATHIDDRWDCAGGWKSLFFGRIDTINPRPEINNQYTYIRAFDDMERQNIHQVYRVAPTAPTTAKEIICEILDATNFDCGNRILDCGETLTHNSQHRKSMGRVALTELYQVQDDDVGLYYMDGAGYAHYEDSCHRARAPHTASRATWRTDRATGTECDKYIGQRFEWDDGKERVENEIWYFYNKISEVSCGVEVWRLNDTAAILDDRPSILAGETFKTLAIGDGDVIACPITPVPTTDFTVNTAKCGSGCDITSCFNASIECGFEGNFRLIALQSNSAQNGFLTFLRLRATKHTASAKAGARAENTQSQTDNGRRSIQHCSLHIDEFDTALDRAQKRVTLRAKPKERVITSMENGTKANLMQMLHRDISDKIDLVYDSLCITNSFHIEGYTITGREGGLYMNTDWELQEAFGGGWDFNRWQATATAEGAFRWA